jgi:hypothetical protein
MNGPRPGIPTTRGAGENPPPRLSVRPTAGAAATDATSGIRGHGAIDSDIPSVPLLALDELWFQVAGTVCNLRCRHCFISCAPDNHSSWFMSRAEVRTALRASVPLAVKEYYFTGGEPFMNREIEGILEDALALGPATVLTNATLMPGRRARALATLAAATPYTLELRVSLDGFTREMNDPIRGEGTFDRCLEGLGELVAAGFLPIVSTMQSWPDEATDEVLGGFRALLAATGYARPRIKVLPPLRIGEEARRTRGYDATERVTHEMLHGYDLDQLLCTRARLVTSRGVYACPILLEAPSARLGDTLDQAVSRRAPLSEAACTTCYTSGAICSNVSPVQGSDR